MVSQFPFSGKFQKSPFVFVISINLVKYTFQEVYFFFLTREKLSSNRKEWGLCRVPSVVEFRWN